MAQRCTVCNHKEIDKINERLIEGATLESLSTAYKVTVAALNRHKNNHLPAHLVKAQEAKEIAAASNLMERVAGLESKADDIYLKAMQAENLNAAIGAVRELRAVTELIAKLTGELQHQTVNNNNIVVMPEWWGIRTAILKALEPYPEARQAVIKAVEGAQA